MSRHRNVRNLTDDDYYDDYYDDDDDDYYEEEEEEDHYDQQQQQPHYQAPTSSSLKPLVSTVKQQQQHSTRQQSLPPSGISSSSSGGGGGGSSSSLAVKMQSLQEMGFSAAQATTALGETKGSVEEATELLLQAKRSTSTFTSAPSLPPPGFSPTCKSDRNHQESKAFTTRSKTPRKAATSSSCATPSTSTPSSSSSSTVAKGTKSTGTSTKHTPCHEEQEEEYGPLSKMSPEVKQRVVVLDHLKEEEQQQKLRLRETNHHHQLTLVVLGHVDAGKSTLMGQLLLQLGLVTERTIAKYQKEAAQIHKQSFALAWVLDEDESERQRGVTMELATKFVSLPHTNITILDAPGHADFIPAMITGAASADVAILVVAATRGEFEAGFHTNNNNDTSPDNTKSKTNTTTTTSSSSGGGGQTREHVVLARGLGVSQLLVAVNKLDVTDWSQERFDFICSQILPFCISNGFAAKRIRFIPISGLTGENVKSRTSPELINWYKGPTLLEAMDSFVPVQRSADKPLRAIVMDVYMEGKNVTCKCRVVQGVVQTGDVIVLLPIGDETAVARIDHFVSQEHNFLAMAGDTVNVILSGIDVARVMTGCVLSHSPLALRPPVKRKMQAKILVMEQLQVPIIRGAQVLFHMHSIDVPAVISKLVATTKRDGAVDKMKPRVITGGTNATVEITLQEKVCLETFADCRALGRFVLRRGGDSIAVGIIEAVL